MLAAAQPMSRIRYKCLILGISIALWGIACSEDTPEAASTPSASASVAELIPPWERKKLSPAAPKGMVWIPPGPLVAGTPPSLLPRIADQEMPGEQVLMKGFFIDIFAYPNEEGAIPHTNMVQGEAKAACEEQSKRLCSELEWERACKGPENTVYEYGNRYSAEACETGQKPKLLPSGLHFSCLSEFGVHDMHGSVWEWTDSPWGRGSKKPRVTLRGGNSPNGQVTGRCANAIPKGPDSKSGTTGFRCCSGERNSAEVSVTVSGKAGLWLKKNTDKLLADQIRRELPRKALRDVKVASEFRIWKRWEWRPIGNDPLTVAGGCAGPSYARRCGLLVLRENPSGIEVLDWASSGRYAPTVHLGRNKKYLWVYGGDVRSHYRKRLTYAWGSVRTFEAQRNPRDVK